MNMMRFSKTLLKKKKNKYTIYNQRQMLYCTWQETRTTVNNVRNISHENRKKSWFT